MLSSLPLEGLYLHLVRSGFPLAGRDFEDAIAALRAGYGLHSRAGLQRLCETLWARTDQEAAQLDRLFRRFPWPSPGEIRKALGLDATGTASSIESVSPADDAAEQGSLFDPNATKDAPAVEFVTPDQSGVGLPRAHVRTRVEETYVMNPRPALALRSLIIALRRFRLAQRSGPKVEVDIDATIAEQSRCGTLVEPILLPARRNQARLLVLIDASPSMTPWRHMNRLMGEALHASQLAETAVYFFDNVPGDELYERDSLSRPQPIDKTLERHVDCALLVLSDAGASRGALNRERVTKTREFVKKASVTRGSIAWVNPMPRLRWENTSAARLAGLRGVKMSELTDDGLTLAVDYLRGKQTV